MVRLPSLALLLLGLGLALAAWAPPAQAGTAEAPEITDAANDHELTPLGHTVTGLGPFCGTPAPCLNRIDILSAWVDEETATSFNLNVLLANAPSAAAEYNSNYEVHATFGGTEVVSSIATDGNGPVAGDNVAAATADGNTLIVTIAKSVYGAPAAGSQLTGLFVTGTATLGANGMDTDQVLATDRAPDADGVAYTFTGGAGGNATGNATDSDGDGLNDTWERQEFGNTTAQNGTGDPDGDGLNNTAEQGLGTNATKADTDGDGRNDKDDPFPLDPAKPGATGNGTGSSGTGGTGGAANDSDRDGLNDTWERSHFGNLTQKGSGDPDRDGLNNTAEQKAGTDPLDADTDGDGLSDATDPHPLGKSGDGTAGRPELYTGSAMFAAAATFCLFGLARRP